jgi:Bacteriophage HK97-gp10, putative tail-component
MSVQWSGLEEFRVLLRDYPVVLHNEARTIVGEFTDRTATEIVAAYPVGTHFGKQRWKAGNLRKGVRVEKHESDLTIINEVRSTAPHAHLWENGTRNRKTKAGWIRGKVIAAWRQGKPTLVSIAMRNRVLMRAALNAMVERLGFQVSGSHDDLAA